MESRLPHSQGADRTTLLNRLATALVEVDPRRSREFFSEALGLARSMDAQEDEAAACFGLGESARVTGDYLEAMEKYSAALHLVQVSGDRLLIGRCLRRLGDVHYFLTNLDLSLRYYLQALRLFEETAESGEIPDSRLHAGHLLSAIGNVLRSSGDMDGALDYYRRSEVVYTQEGCSEGLPGVVYNIGNVMQEKGRLDEAETAYREILGQAVEKGDDYLTSLALNSLGSILLVRKDFAPAEELFRQSLETSGRTNRKRGILVSLSKLLELQRLKGAHQEALDLSGQAESLARELGDKAMLGSILRERALVFEAAGDLRGAYQAISGYLEIQQEQLSEKRVQQINVLRLYYETEAREKEIERLSLTNRKLATAYSRVEELTRTDVLTGLANRRAAMERMRSQQAHFAGTGIGFGVILADIDSFKASNDRLGHECGDAILVQLAERLRVSLRKQDLAVRWGGDEFLFLLAETDLEGAGLVAETLRRVIESEPFTWNGTPIPVTMTFGVCEGCGLPMEELIRLADQAMYMGKSLGRNRVEISPPGRDT